MKLSTRSRYGTRLMLDLARFYDQAPIPLAEIAKRQKLSVKYLEQLIIPLKASGLIQSVPAELGEAIGWPGVLTGSQLAR